MNLTLKVQVENIAEVVDKVNHVLFKSGVWLSFIKVSLVTKLYVMCRMELLRVRGLNWAHCELQENLFTIPVRNRGLNLLKSPINV